LTKPIRASTQQALKCKRPPTEAASLHWLTRSFGTTVGGTRRLQEFPAKNKKKQGATGITTVAPYIAGQWGRGNNRLLERLTSPEVVPAAFKYFQKFSYTVK
jgi:hypothetical protein